MGDHELFGRKLDAGNLVLFTIQLGTVGAAGLSNV